MDNNKNQTKTLNLSPMCNSSVERERFKINHYEFMKDHPFDDMVTTSAPYFHFQILKPKDEEQKQKAIDYFQNNKKLFVAWVNFSHILLYLGATEDVYIRSRMCDSVDGDALKKVLKDAEHWYRLYGVEQ